MKRKSIFIVSSAIGIEGGSDKATKLLAEEYFKLGYIVYVFVTTAEFKSTNPKLKYYTPFINRGHKFLVPQRILILQLLIALKYIKPILIHCIGITVEVRFVLKTIRKFKIIVWETTEANHNNKFIDNKAIPLLKNAEFCWLHQI